MAIRKSIDKEAIGRQTLSFCEKIRLLSERYRRQGQVFADLIGVSPVTLSRWANGHVGEISPEHTEKLVELGCGLLVAHEEVLERKAAVKPKPALVPVKPKPEPKKPAPVKAKPAAAVKKPEPSLFDEDEDDMDL